VNSICSKSINWSWIASNAEVFKTIAETLEFDQLIWEFGNDENPEWVHVSFSEGHNRKQMLKAVKKHGKTVYLPFESAEETKVEKAPKAPKAPKAEK